MPLTNTQDQSAVISLETIDRLNAEAWMMRRSDPRKLIGLAMLAREKSVPLNYKTGLAYSFRSTGVAYLTMGQYQMALPDLLKSQSYFLELNDFKGASSALRNIGNIYTQLSVFEKAEYYYNIAIEYAERSKDLKSITYVRTNLGLIEQLKGNYVKAIKMMEESLGVLRDIGDDYAISEILFNIGNNYLNANDTDKAKAYLDEALEIASRLNYLKGIAQSYVTLGQLYFKLGNDEKALVLMQHGVASALELNEKRIAAETYKLLGRVHKKIGNISKALECMEMHDEMKTRLQISDTKSLLDSLQGEIDLEKSEKRSLENKNRELEFAYQVIKEKNKDITDSIKYARHIQNALLPPSGFLNQYVKDYFVFYQSKEIVSGDLYWFNQKNGLVYFAVIDCTGHGVPGAFISIVAHNTFEQAFRELGNSSAAAFLNRASVLFNEYIRQTYEDSTVRDGMDVSFCIFDFNNRQLSFAGANHDLVIIRNGEKIEVKGNKHAIGIFLGEETRSFTDNHVDLQPGDMVYLFTDGYADQFGGVAGQKYMKKRLKNLLTEISGEHPKDQLNHLRYDFNTWKGSMEQVDDVLVTGFRIS
jgi:serine phosphatase RsbU (regulator of sigma subunit)